MFELNVDCANKKVTLIWKAWGDENITAQDEADIRAAVDRFWNPKPPHKYFDCDVVVEVEFLRKADAKDKPTNFDWITIGMPPPGGKPGDGSTIGGPGVATPTPEGTVRIIFSRDAAGKIPPGAVRKAVGDALGIPPGAGGAPWDKNGIQPGHILRAFANATYAKADGTSVGWEPRAGCCKPKAAGGGEKPKEPKEPKKPKKGKRRAR